MMQRTHLKLICVISLLSLALGCSAFADTILYVDDDAPLNGDGKSWDTAYPYLQNALMNAKEANKPVEIRIAQGVYKPTADRFELISGVALKGGYVGLGMPDPNERDIKLYETIFSGDLLGNDVNVDNPHDLGGEPTRVDNVGILGSYQADSTAVLDGVTITGGRQPNPPDARFGGGGMLIGSFGMGRGSSIESSSSPTIINCTFRDNWSSSTGGAVYIVSGYPTFHNCTFTQNYSYYGGAISGGEDGTKIINCFFAKNTAKGGGAIADCVGLISNCLFQGNVVDNTGGALADCSGLMTNVFFFDNSAGSYGGAASVTYRDSAMFENCIFADNVAKYSGGGVLVSDDGTVVLINCTFSSNSSPVGCALVSYPSAPLSNAKLTNCILRDGGNEILKNDNSIISVTYSNVHGGYDGIGNINENPLFADPNNGDFHLKSKGGRWDPNSESWIMDKVTSPCIDTGDPVSPIGMEPFPNGGRINMGAYGGTVEASKSYFGTSPCETIIAGDINGDCKVDFLDLAILASHWFEENEHEKDEYGQNEQGG